MPGNATQKNFKSWDYILLITLIFLVGSFTIYLLKDTAYYLLHAITLKTYGVQSSATVLEYQPATIRTNNFLSRYGRSDTSYLHVITYDGNTCEIELSRQFQINHRLPVLYDRNNPSLVWQGMNNLSIWNLLSINMRISIFPKGDIISVAIANLCGVWATCKLVMIIIKGA